MIKDMETAPPPSADAALLERTERWVSQAYAEGRPEAMTGIVEYRKEDGVAIKVLNGGGVDEQAKRLFIGSMQYLSARNASPRSAVAYESWIVESDDPVQMRKAQRMVERGQSISRHPFAREMVMVNVESEAGTTMLRLDIDRAEGRAMLSRHSAPIFMPKGGDGFQGGGLLSGFHIPFARRIDPAFMTWCAGMERHVRGMMTAEG